MNSSAPHNPGQLSERPKEILACGALLLLIVIFFWEMLVEGKVPLMRDMFFDFLPQHEFAGEVIRSGHVPLWSAYSGWGKPFVADPQAAAFYPLHAFFYFLPAALAVKLYCIVHLWIVGVGMFALARHWCLDITAALLVAVGCVFSSWMISCLEFANNLGAIVWSPLILLVTSKIVQALAPDHPIPWRRLTRLMTVLSLLFAVQYLAGYPEFVAYTGIFALAYVVAMCIWRRDGRALGLSVLVFGLAGLFALLLTSPQFLLSWEFLHFSERAEKIDPGLPMASVHPLNLLDLMLPYINGQPGYPDRYWAGAIIEFMLGTSYVGLLPLVVAPFSLLWLSCEKRDETISQRRFLCLFLFAAGFVALVMAFGQYTPLYGFLYKTLPGFNRFRFPSKFLVLFLFSLLMLMGLGCQGIIESRTDGNLSRRLCRKLQISGALLLGGLVVGFIVACHTPSFFNRLTQVGVRTRRSNTQRN